MKNTLILLITLWSIVTTNVYAQSVSKDHIEKKHFIGSTLFVLATPIVSPSPEYFQLNYGYRLTPKDVISIEAITWAYRGPLGRPYGPDYENVNSDFPGKVKAYGLGLASTSVTNIIDRLEAQGLVRRTSHPTDRRTTLAEITEDGRRVVDKATEVVSATDFGIGALSDGELDQVTDLLRTVRIDAGDFPG
jgi:hypothetical protein